ncbi:hypothetical protein N7457_000054 [Penicillium paradoxum]|uniref:uncharacterized protein n=1 Tax=Penicillium paradoxum TaxID=176176 RepID=UPI002547FE9A|nr:uncharacterized protein N7457_000054 [Penicillium paradoxum]KAJ5793455.1 hypothetical protein N7457_000054 [Penicillium paradoxum]
MTLVDAIATRNTSPFKLQLRRVDYSHFCITNMETERPPPTLTNPRFTLELEFVSSLANPYYLSHLAVTYPGLLGISRADDDDDSSSPDAQAFAAYLAYLYSYWKTPEYSQFLTHPGPTLRALRLLQEDTFRRDIILPQVIEGLAGVSVPEPAQAEADPADEKQEDGQNGKT